VLGIGVNVQVDPGLLPERSTSLQLCCPHPPTVDEFATDLLVQLKDLLQVHRAQGLAAYLDEVRALSLAAGTPIRYWLDQQELRGRVAGLDDRGFLVLESGQHLPAVDRLVVESTP
jgi:biotin-(acetyl-CoA carboxylase) ligase